VDQNQSRAGGEAVAEIFDFTFDTAPSFKTAERDRNQDAALLRRVEWLARMLDDRFSVPGTGIRFGWDQIIGFVPGIGDAAMTGVSLVILHHGWKLGMPKSALVRMGANIAVDFVIGSVPVIGDAFDFAWKANKKNLRLVQQHVVRSTPGGRARQAMRSRWR
jgi:hypothetical protein